MTKLMLEGIVAMLIRANKFLDDTTNGLVSRLVRFVVGEKGILGGNGSRHFECEGPFDVIFSYFKYKNSILVFIHSKNAKIIKKNFSFVLFFDITF